LKLLRAIGILLMLALAIGLLKGWFMGFVVGQYYLSAPIYLTALYGVVWPIIVVYGTYRAIRWIISAESIN
jgi:membrane protein YdbS with pleckstrin-like domain